MNFDPGVSRFFGNRSQLGELLCTGLPEVDEGKVISFPKRRRVCWEHPTNPGESTELVAGVRFELTTFGL
jgi:hypothetical protein